LYQAFSSPARKRQRLSSPTYDDQVGDLTQEDLNAFDEIEARISQKSKFEEKFDWNHSHTLEPSSSNPGLTLDNEKNDPDLQDDPDNPFTVGFTSAAAAVKVLVPFRPPTIGFASAAKLPTLDDYRSPSPEEPPSEPDVDAWFNPAPLEALPLFTSAKSIVVPELVGFTKASMNGVIKPSSKALAKAKALLEVWESEDVNPSTTTHETNSSDSLAKADPSIFQKPPPERQISPQRVALRTVENIGNTPGTSPSSGFSHTLTAGPPRGMSSPSLLHRPMAFRSPLLKNIHTSNGVMSGSPLNPNRPINSLNFSSAASQLPHPLSASVNVSPSPASTPQAGFVKPSSFMTPPRPSVRPSGTLRTRPAPFVTPFKPGMRPGDPGRSKLGQSPVVTISPLALNAAARKEPPQNCLTKDRPACVLQRKEFFSLGWCTTLSPHLCR
jgi:breast cancer 2 susceptibility protein